MPTTDVAKKPKPPEGYREMLPAKVARATRDLLAEDTVVDAMLRVADYGGNEMRAMLAGIGADRRARDYLDEAMDELFDANPRARLDGVHDEVIVGAGLHAAVYCAVRAARGAPPPLVLEASARVGGIFACSRGPSFFLNSRNRPGPLRRGSALAGPSVPGEGGELNHIPAGVVQPADLPGGEYQTNDDMAWLIRLHLAMFGRVATGFRVIGIERVEVEPGVPGFAVVGDDGPDVQARRVIVAPGLGQPRRMLTSERLLTFPELMARMDERFPLAGMDRVAVLGAGDGGKAAVEALCGQGPRATSATLDWPRLVDWYDAKLPDSAIWEECNRSRYARIGALLRSGRVRRVATNPETAVTGYQSVFVEGVPYDHVIDCRGFDQRVPSTPSWVRDAYRVGNRSVADWFPGYECYVVGPAAGLALTESEGRLAERVPENSTAIFRYADRTAVLAEDRPLPAPAPAPAPVVEPSSPPVPLRYGKAVVRDSAGAALNVGARVKSPIGDALVYAGSAGSEGRLVVYPLSGDPGGGGERLVYGGVEKNGWVTYADRVTAYPATPVPDPPVRAAKGR